LRYTQGQSLYNILADAARATRNDRFKLVQTIQPGFNPATNMCETATTFEFYEINEAVPLPKLDRADANLLTSPDLPPQGLTPLQLANFNALYAELQRVLHSEPACPGDGNLDKRVDLGDVVNWKFFRIISGGQSSWYDFNFDGLTNAADRSIIQQHLGTNCLKKQ
jgi:hypothetical protein